MSNYEPIGGAWNVAKKHYGFQVITDAAGYVVADVWTQDERPGLQSDKQAEADQAAALIAAAPDLLAAARAAARSHMVYGKVMQRDIEQLLSAIAKAQAVQA